MNFGVSGESIGLIGFFILFGAAMLVFIVIVTVIVRVVHGQDDTPAEPDAAAVRRAPEDDYLL